MIKIHERRRLEILICLLLVATIIVAFWQLPGHDFVNLDDHEYVDQNKLVTNGLDIKNIINAFKFNGVAYWHPVTWLSHMLDFQLFGANPGMHHLTSLLIHIAATLLLFVSLNRMSGSLWPSAFVAALFGLHPLNVESVAWIAERKNVLSTFFWMLTLLVYGRYTEQPGFKRYLVVLAVFCLGLMAKPMLVTLPCVLLLLDYWPLGRMRLSDSSTAKNSSSGKIKNPALKRSLLFGLILEKIPLLALGSISIFLSLFSYQQVISYQTIPLNLRVANALVSYVSYMTKMVWPQKLAVFYPYPATLPVLQAAGAGLLLLAVSIAVLRNIGSRPYLTVGWLWYLGTLVPVLGMVQWGLWPGMADRFAYVPLVGLFIMVAWGVPELLKKYAHRKMYLVISAMTLIFVLTVCTFFQVRHWKNSQTLFQHAIQATDDNYFAQNGLGISFFQAGQFDQAIIHFRKALAIKPDYDVAHSNLGLVLFEQGKIDKAIFRYKHALEIRPDNVAALFNLANALADTGQWDKAVFYYKKALKIMPEYAAAQFNLANTLVHQNNLDEAAVHYSEALRIDPQNAETQYNYALLLIKQAKYKAALTHLTQAAEINPELLAPAYDQMGVILVRQGNYKNARRFFLKAIQIKPDFSRARNHLKTVETSNE